MLRAHLARAVPRRGPNGRIEAWYGTFTDIDERTLAERSSRERERDVLDVTDALPLIVWTASPTGEIDAYNKRWYEYTGLPGGEIAGFGWGGVVHPDDFAETVLAYARGLESGHRFALESRMRGADGTYRRHRTVAEPVRDDRGTLQRWVGSTQDIEAQHRAHAAQTALLERTEHTTRQLRFLAEFGRGLARSLDFDETAHAIVTQIVPAYADWAVVRLVDGAGRPQTVATAHDRPDSLPALHAFARQSSGAFATAAVARAIRSQTTVLHERVDPDASADYSATIVPHSSVVVPLATDGGVRGALHLAYTSAARRYTPDDVPLLEEVGRRSAAAIANALRFGREHRVADRLQRALLPSFLPQLPEIRLDAHYAAGRTEAQIGGDWYDAFLVGDRQLVLTIGDVCGSGLEAAVTMAAVRQSIRSLAQADADPAIILDMADRALRAEDPNAIVTAAAIVYDLVQRRLTYACAGHVPPLVREPDGAVRILHAPDLPLGLRDGVTASPLRIDVAPGSTLVLYTDGVTEVDRDPIAGERRLIDALARAPLAFDAPLAGYLAHELVPDGSRDDVAILTMRVA